MLALVRAQIGVSELLFRLRWGCWLYGLIDNTAYTYVFCCFTSYNSPIGLKFHYREHSAHFIFT